jgi:hypothetical protein
MVKDISATEGRLLDREVLGLHELLVGDAQLRRVAALPDELGWRMLGFRVHGLDLSRLVHGLELLGVQAEFVILCEDALLVGYVQRVVAFQVAHEGCPVLPKGRTCLLLGLEALIGGDIFHAFASEGQVVH